ncbi:homoserine dehydrogenase [Salinibacter ruber]|nr:homoserine dehydrogenase [Salinibacter ruber]
MRRTLSGFAHGWSTEIEIKTASQYVGRFSPEGIEVGVEPVPGDTALGQLGAQENLFEVTTDRYAAVPLVVRGPGAGPSVTAAGVLADVLTAVREARPPSPPA